jgi:hypothetical protein
MKPGMNLCGTVDEPELPGHPIVVFSNRTKLRALVAAEKTRNDCLPLKTKRGIHVFVTGPTSNDWRHLGEYEICHVAIEDDVAHRLPTGEGFREKMHPLLQQAFNGHVNETSSDWTTEVTRSWNFEARTYRGAVRELGKGTSSPVMRYVVLRCVGFDEGCYMTWARKRGDEVSASEEEEEE